MTQQAETSLPAGALLRADCVAGLVAAGLGFLGGILFATEGSTGAMTALGAGLATVVAVLGTLLVRPTRKRPVLAWANLLIVLASGRLVASVGACLLLYFAAQLPAVPLLAGMLMTLVFVLFSETRIAAGCFRKLDTTDAVEGPDTPPIS